MLRIATIFPYLTLQETPGTLVLRERARPGLAAVWCYGVVGLTCYVAHLFRTRGGHLIPSQDQTVLFYVFITLGVLIASAVVAAEVWKLKRKPILVFDRANHQIALPRLNLVFAHPSELLLGWQEEEIDLGENSRGLVDVLYLRQPEIGSQPTKLGVEYLAGALPPLLQQLAEASGLRIDGKPNPTRETQGVPRGTGTT